MKIINKNVYIAFTITFIIFLLIGLIPLEIKSKQVLGFGLFTDGLKQHLPFLRDYVLEMKKALAGNGLQIYRYNLGLGSDFIISYTYYSLFDPLTIIAYILPISYIETSFYLMIILRLYLAGIFIILLARKLGIHNFYALFATSIFYCFNITILFTAFRHPMFINGPMLLPLIILGAEKVLRDESFLVLIFTVYFALINQFYFFLYACVAFELYVIIRLFITNDKPKKPFKMFIKINILYVLGTLLGSFVLLPQALAILSGSRITSKGFIFYDYRNFSQILASYLFPYVGNHYTSGIGNGFVLFIVLIFLFNQNKKSWESIYFLITSGFIFISFFGYALNAFAYVNNRWSYIITLPAAIILGRVIEQCEDIKTLSIKKAIKTILIIAYLGLGFYIASLFKGFILQSFVLLIIIIIGYIGLRKVKITKTIIITKKKIAKFTLITSFIVLIANTCIYTVVSASEGLNAYGDLNTYQTISRDQDFFRVEQNKFVLNTDYYSNDNLLYGFNSTYFYNSMANKHIGEVIEFFNVVNDNTTAGYNGFNSRYYLNSINNVKYIIIRESENKLPPYGFELLEKVKVEKFVLDKYNPEGLGYIEYDNGKKVYEDAYIYINKNFLNFGFVYHNYINVNEVLKLNYLDRERLILDAVILDEDINLNKFRNFENTNYYVINNYTTDNIQISDNYLTSFSGGGKITFTTPIINNSELFIEIKSIKKLDKDQSFTITYKANDYQDQEHNFRYGTLNHIENPDHLINLGYYHNKQVDVEIYFPEGEYEFEKMGYYLNSMDSVLNKINDLNDETFTDLEFNNHGFTGKVNVKEDGILFISLPYSSGFKAFVDGKETKIFKAHVGYMGILVSSGNHEIEFVYKTPGLFWGINISIISLIIVLSVLWRKYNKRYY